MTNAFSTFSPCNLTTAFLWAAICLCVSNGAISPAPPEKTDIYGDPLPEGAFARLGTLRLRALCGSLHFSADGKTLVGVDAGREIRVWDAGSGQLKESRLLPGRPERKRWNILAAFSSSGETMVIADGSLLEMWDIPTGKQLNLPLPRARDSLDRIAISRDGRLVLFAQATKEKPLTGALKLIPLPHKQELTLWDTATGQAKLLADNEARLVGLAISPDGRYLASSSYGKGTRVWEAGNGEILWSEPKYNAEMVAFTSDGAHLISAPGGGQGEWRIWDTITGQPAKNLQPPTAGYAWSFALSPDGNLLLIPTVTDYILWDLQAGIIRHRWPGANQAGQGLFAPDGRSVVTYDAILRRWDVVTGKLLYADVSPHGHTAAVERLFFTPDGKRLASVGEDATARVWDVTSSKALYRGTLDNKQKPTAWALSPDGTVLVGLDEGLTVQRWSLASLRPEKSFTLKEAKDLNVRWQTLDIRFGPAGQTLAVSIWPRATDNSLSKFSFSFWNAQTGRLSQWGGDPGREYRGNRGTLSPDGRFAAVDGMLYDTLASASRLPLAVYETKGTYVRPLFSPSGRLLAQEKKKGIRVWEVATGRPLLDLPEASLQLANFSADDRLFVNKNPDGFQVTDLRTAKVILERTAPANRNRYDSWAGADFTFSPDGLSLATGQTDGTILLWNVPSVAQPGNHHGEEELAELWDTLGKEDPAKAWSAIWRFQEDAGAAVRFLEKKIPLWDMPAEEDFRTLIKGLDADTFKEREAANRALKKLGRMAEGNLRAALLNTPSPEQKQRLDGLLKTMPPVGWPQGDNLRYVRAVAVLEGCDIPEARRLLETWAQRVPDAWVADEAMRALTRVRMRK